MGKLISILWVLFWVSMTIKAIYGDWKFNKRKI